MKISLFDRIIKWLKSIDNDTIIVYIIFIFFYFCIFIQHSQVWIYFDDYGLASLSYNKIIPNVEGTHYSLADLLEWLSWCYNNWGGRILSSLIAIPLLKKPQIFMYCQSIVVIAIMILSYKIACYSVNRRHSIFIATILPILYGLTSINVLRHGLYWAASSKSLVWPLFPGLLSILLFLKKTGYKLNVNEKEFSTVNNIRDILIISVLALCASSFHEQIGIAFFMFFLSHIFFIQKKQFKKNSILNIAVLISTMAGSLFVILAPGNYVRINNPLYYSYNQLSLYEKTIMSYNKIILLLFKDGGLQYIISLLLIIILLITIDIYKYLKSNTIKKLIIGTSITISMTGFIFISGKYYNENISMIFSLLFFIYLTFLIYYHNQKSYTQSLFPLLIMSGVIVFSLIVSPTIAPRAMMPFLFIVFIPISIIFYQYLCQFSQKLNYSILIITFILSILSIINYYYIFNGYRLNYSIHTINHDKLKLASIKRNEKEIKLYKLYNGVFASLMGYGHHMFSQGTERWMKEYYNLPQDISFVWIDLRKE